ncbi:MAG: N-acetylglucosamine-6-phosphate deacetylase [Saprospiraceae bacterium]
MVGRLKIGNGPIITQDKILSGSCLLVENGKILAIEPVDTSFPDSQLIDAQGYYISPGFMDIHLHGGGGFDFMDGTREAFLNIAQIHAKHGTTSMLPTTLTCEKEDLIQTLEAYSQACLQNTHGAHFVGMHLEGPYFALSQRGAQDPKYIRDPDPKEYKEIIESYPFIKRWSAAPELKGAVEFGKYISSKGVLAAIAHTDAIYEEVLEAFQQGGYTLATHFYSAMSGVTRRNAFRYAGVIESAYLLDEMDVEIIADGVHLPAPLLKLVYKLKGPGRIALITDAMRAADMPPGDSVLGSLKNGLPVLVEDGVAKLPDRTAFAGSVATADRLIRTMLEMAEVPLIECIRMISETPARIMNIQDKKGTLAPGKDADIVIFNAQIEVQQTFVMGKSIFQKT